MSNILLISSCTKDKEYKGFDINQLPHTIKQLRINTIDSYMLDRYSSKAKDLYLGLGHKYIKLALDIFKSKNIDIDWNILSAGYGLLDPDKIIVPYDITFNILTNQEIIESSNELNIPIDIDKAIKDHDVIIFALSYLYLKAIQFDKLVNLNKDKTLIFIDNIDSYELDKHIYKLIDNKANIKIWFVNRKEDKSIEYDTFRESKVLEVAKDQTNHI